MPTSGARDGGAPGAGRPRARARPHRLRQPPVRPVVRHGALRQSPRRFRRDRVVNPELAAAYAACEQLARSHYENFPVASRLLPAKMRPHVAAIYAFARLADDMADEGTRPAAERLADLDRWGARLDAALDGTAVDREPNAFVFVAVRQSIQACGLPRALFPDLLSAFRQDVTVPRYATWEALLDYCRRSANPVGRLVLRVAGPDVRGSASGLTADAASDAVCTALQLTNFWQDLEIDW